MTASTWSVWSTEYLIKEAQRQARLLETVRAMPEGERTRKAPGRSTSPDEAACINRFLLVQYGDELRRRGVDLDKILV